MAFEFLKEGYQVRGTVRDIKNTSKYKFVEQFPNKENLEIYQLNLENQEEIEKAVKGCEYIAHVASPVIMSSKVEERHVVNPAIEGCLYILFAASKYNVKAVVVTGSVAANSFKHKRPVQNNGHNITIIDENDWSNLEGIEKFGSYVKSKTLEEKKAWEYYQTIDPSNRFRLSFINPSFVFGPFFTEQAKSSAIILYKLMNREIPRIPDVTFNCVDVRDVAKAHRLAIETPEADGKRFICNGELLHMRQICEIVRPDYPELNIPTADANYYFLYLLSFCKSELNFVIFSWGKTVKFETTRIQDILKMKYTPIKTTIQEMARCLVEKGIIKPPKKEK